MRGKVRHCDKYFPLFQPKRKANGSMGYLQKGLSLTVVCEPRPLALHDCGVSSSVSTKWQHGLSAKRSLTVVCEPMPLALHDCGVGSSVSTSESIQRGLT